MNENNEKINIDDEIELCECGRPTRVYVSQQMCFDYDPEKKRFVKQWTGDTEFQIDGIGNTIFYCSGCDEEIEDCECKKLEEK